MSTNRFASILFVVGSIAGVITMAFHPTGPEVVRNASAGEHNSLAIALHSLALFAEPLLLSGALMAIPAMGRSRELAVTGVVFFALACCAGMVATAASGFIAPGTLADYGSADPAKQALLLSSFHYTGLINQTFSRLYSMFAATAILFWSFSVLGGATLSRGLGISGLFYGALVLLGLASFQLHMDIHGFGLVVLGQSIWFVAAAIQLWRWRVP